MDVTITEHTKVEPVYYDWGAVKWVCNANVATGCEQSFGLVHVLPGRTNPEHWHTAAEEIIFMLSGECDIRVGERSYKLTTGQTMYISPGVKHELTNRGWEPAVYVASFSASTRGTLFEEPDAPGARPTTSEPRR